MSRIKIVTVTKDEYDLIEDWIIFHGALVGYDNLLVLDHGSSHPAVLQAYSKYSDLGVRIETRVGSFENKSMWWTEACQRPDAELVFPLDTDEFLVAPAAKENSNNAVREICERLLLGARCSHFVIENYLYANVTGSEPWYIEHQQSPRPARDISQFRSTAVSDKCFFRPSAIALVSTGNHFNANRVHWGEYAVAHELALLHFHYTGERRRVERSLKLVFARQIINRNDDEDTVLRKLCAYNGPSRHAAAHLVDHFKRRGALSPSASDSGVYGPRNTRTHGLEQDSKFEVVEWPFASQLLKSEATCPAIATFQVGNQR